MVATAPSRLRFGPYDIERKLGRGMTDVYLGFDSVSGRRAVLKLIRHATAARQVIEAERRGASIQQQLHAFDPRVIEVYDYGDLEGCFFVALEYVEGETVAQILKRERRLDPARATRIAMEVAAQLEALHSFQVQIDGRAAAVVHGDIKPSNIQVGADGYIRLLDFGIAKSVTLLRNLTVHEFGSPNYCSPERLDRSQVDTDADLWSLGVTLYEMVAGSPPYQADDTRKLEHLIQSKRPPRALPGTCPRGLKAIIGKALAADAGQRYGTATIFREDLTAFLENRPTVAERERRRPWKVNPTVDAGGRQVSAWTWPWTLPWTLPEIPYARVAAGLACVLLGMAVFLATGYYWRVRSEAATFRARLDLARRTASEARQPLQEWQRMNQEYGFLGRFSPAVELQAPLRAAYVAAADAVIDGYRAGADPSIQKTDWPKAQVCLEQALAMDATDPVSRGKLALVQGYIALPSQIENAKLKFIEAVTAIPASPDPHLAMARLYAYSYRDTERALAELTVAEALGYKPQPREIEQKADAYRFRAWKELGKAWSKGTAPEESQRLVVLGQRDLEAAEALYKEIPNFNQSEAHLRQVRSVYKKTLPQPPQPNPAAHRRARKWR
jgi:tRNA A-37 threonylcarbamoyl transferase component Bud32